MPSAPSNVGLPLLFAAVLALCSCSSTISEPGAREYSTSLPEFMLGSDAGVPAASDGGEELIRNPVTVSGKVTLSNRETDREVRLVLQPLDGGRFRLALPAPDFVLELEQGHRYQLRFEADGYLPLSLPVLDAGVLSATTLLPENVLTQGTLIDEGPGLALVGSASNSAIPATMLALGTRWMLLKADPEGAVGVSPLDGLVVSQFFTTAVFFPDGKLACVPQEDGWHLVDVAGAKLLGASSLLTSALPLSSFARTAARGVSFDGTYHLFSWDETGVSSLGDFTSLLSLSPAGTRLTAITFPGPKVSLVDPATGTSEELGSFNSAAPKPVRYLPADDGSWALVAERAATAVGDNRDCWTDAEGCRLSIARPGSPPSSTLVEAAAFFHAISAAAPSVVYLTASGELWHYDVTTGAKTSIALGAVNDRTAGWVVGDYLVLQDGVGIRVIELATGSIQETVAGYWRSVVQRHDFSLLLESAEELVVVDPRKGPARHVARPAGSEVFANGERYLIDRLTGFPAAQEGLLVGVQGEATPARTVARGRGVGVVLKDFSAPCALYHRPAEGWLTSNGTYQNDAFFCVR